MMDFLEQSIFLPVEGAVTWFISWITRHPAMILIVIWWMFKRHRAKQPWPDYGGDVTMVTDKASWEALQESTGKEGRLICIDAYATWCPPCKAAAPPPPARGRRAPRRRVGA